MSSGPQVPVTPPGGGGRLTEEQQKLVAILLSDPTYFPVEFRTWLRNFLESLGFVTTSTLGGGPRLATGLPAGLILAVATSAVPIDCLVCDGTVKIRADYTSLFNAIGVTWGAGDGSTTFNIPDLRDRALFGVGGKIGLAQTDGVAFGSRGGPFHKHSFAGTTNSVGSHNHGGNVGGAGGHSHSFSGNGGGSGGGSGGGATDTEPGHSHGPQSGGTFALTNLVTAPLGSGGSSRLIVSGGDYVTGTGGGHDHSVSVDVNVDVDVTVSGNTSSVGDHNHPVTADGQHSHTVSGDTSGGFSYDRPSYAGVTYVITTGG